MRTYLDCLPCLFSQSLRAARAATADEEVHRRVLDGVAAMIPQLSLGLIPPEIAQRVYRLIYQLTGIDDPFRKLKDESNRVALALYPRLKQLVADSEEPLLMACKLAIAGNSIDFGPNFNPGSINDMVDVALSSSLVVDDYGIFRSSVMRSRCLLYLADNAGEILFDRVLIEELCRFEGLEVDFVVRGGPAINDATVDDAIAVGIDRVARVVPSGSNAPATILSQCSPEVLKLYHSADIVIAKGQGNYESLSDEPGDILFLLRAKCPIVADQLGVNIGDIILKRHSKE